MYMSYVLDFREKGEIYPFLRLIFCVEKCMKFILLSLFLKVSV